MGRRRRQHVLAIDKSSPSCYTPSVSTFNPFDVEDLRGTNAKRAVNLRGTGRWIVEYERDEEWLPTIWRGVSLDIAMREAKRLQREENRDCRDLTFRIRNADTNDTLLAHVL